MIHERIPPKTLNKNAHIESYHAIIELECYRRHEFESYSQAYEIVSEFILDYNHIRLHGSIYDLGRHLKQFFDQCRIRGAVSTIRVFNRYLCVGCLLWLVLRILEQSASL